MGVGGLVKGRFLLFAGWRVSSTGELSLKIPASFLFVHTVQVYIQVYVLFFSIDILYIQYKYIHIRVCPFFYIWIYSS